ncbi:filamentous hemagglutinin N-terminal domain-containing protein [Aquabacterium sp.]|uniref:two-partner secretion domain-containing protein n=1 Tax=Aquabacterium sp. TaxID=1872578 RepID=UPI0024899196|nr:filamentous hemagglutinin N-terminal domain-containing protein [Aquabacterium sp.]MDI1258122.1 filamentous hemagglutinin N-terminal domain-containing protein [Aquabacterium sp.]
MKRSTLTHARRLAQRGCFALRPLSAAAALLILSEGAMAQTAALPSTGKVIYGDVTTTQPNANTLNIHQGSDKAYVQYDSFSIGLGNKVVIQQPTTTSTFLGQVTGYDASFIMGQLQANGRVFLINPNGIVFGEHARVDVGSLLATTMSLSLGDFLNNRILLTSNPTDGRGDLAGVVRNDGTITAKDGFVVLAGREVINTGQILAENGRVGLAAASKLLVDVEGDGLLFFEVEGKDAGARLAQLGRIEANGGSVEMMAAARGQFADTVLNMSGVVQARSLGMKQGRVVIDGGDSGVTSVTGQVDVSGLQAGERGGSVSILGDRVGLFEHASINASGAAGGGDVKLGGDFHGQGTARRASQTLVGRDVSIKADATVQGDGGQVVAWADGDTRFLGSISARGGALGGNGGQAEVSGRETLDYRGQTDLRGGAGGAKGTLLLDPRNIEIVAAGPDIGGDAGGLDLTAASFSANAGGAGSVSKITAGAVVAQLDLANVHLSADKAITVSSAVDASANAGDFGLQLTAGDQIILKADVITRNGLTLDGTLSSGGINLTGALAPVTLNAGAGKLSLGAAVNGVAQGLTLASTNTAADAIKTTGTVTNVAALNVQGKSTLGGNVTTIGDQTYTGTTTLAGNTQLDAAASKVSLALVDGGGHNLTVLTTSAAADAISTSGTVSNTAVLSVQGKATLGGNVTTTGNQTYTGPVALAANAQLDAGAAKVSLTSVDGGTHDLTVISSNAAADAIKTTGAITNTAALSVQGKSTLGADVTTTGNQTYTGTTTLGANAQLDAGAGKVALAAVDGGTHNLTVFSSNVAADAIKTTGAITNTAVLSVQGKSTLGADVTTTGNQTYTGTTTLGANAQLNAGAAKLALAAVDGGTNNLTLVSSNAAADAVKTTGAITNTAALSVQGKVTLGGDVTTTGGQTYDSAVTLAAPVTLKGDSLSLTSLAAGINDVGLRADTITLTGAATGTANAIFEPLSDTGSISVAGGLPVAANTLQLSQALLDKFSTYQSIVVGSAANAYTIGFGDFVLPTKTVVRSASGAVTFAKLDGAFALEAQTTGTISLNDLIGGTNALSSVDLNGPVTVSTSLVKTSGNQTYSGAVTLAATTSLEAGAGKVSLTSVDGGGAHDLTLKSANAAADAVKTTGTISNVRALDVQGKVTLGGDVTSTGNQTYGDTTTLASNVTLDAGAAKVSLAGVAGATHDLTVKSSNAAADAIKTTAAIGGVGALGLQGKTTLGANVVTTGAQDYTGPVTLGGAVTVNSNGANVRFRDTVDGAQALTANAGAGNARFDGAVGGDTALTSLGVTAASVDLNGGAMTTSGAQTYTTPTVTLGANTTFTTSNLQATGNLNAGAHNLSVFADALGVAGNILSTGAGNASIAGRLASTSIGLAGGAGDLQVTGALLGKFASFGSVTVGRTDGTANITFGNMTGGTALNRSLNVRNGSGDIVFGQVDTTVDGFFNLDAATTTGTVRLNGDVGGISRLNSLTLGGPTRIAASNIFTGGFQRYNGAVTLASDVNMNATTATFGSTVNGAHHLTVTLPSSSFSYYAYFIGAVGGTTPLASLTVNGNTYVEDNVITSGAQYYGASAILLDDATFTGTALTFNTNLAAGANDLGLLTDALFIGGTLSGSGAAQIAPYTVGRDIVVSGTGSGGELVVDASTFSQFSSFSSLTVGRADGTGTITLGSSGALGSTALLTDLTLLSGTGDITVLSAINGAHSLALNTGGTTRINASLSGLTAVSTNAGGTTRIGASVDTNGDTIGGTQTYGDAVTLDNSANLTSTAVAFDDTVNGASAGGQALTVNGNARFGQAVGASQALNSVRVTGTTQFDHGGASSTGSQVYVGAVTLGDVSNFNASGAFVRFENTVTGPHALTTNTATGTVFFNAVNVASVNVGSGLSYLYGGSVTTTGTQTYAANSLLGANNTLTGTNIAFGGTVDGGQTLAINASGTTTLGGAVGATTALTSLSTSGVTNLNGASIRTTGAQSYGGAVTLGANTTVTANTVDFNGTVNGARTLLVNDSGTTTFHGNVGGTAALTSLATTAGGSTVLPAQVTTSGAQVYGDPVTLSANTALSANSVSMANLIGASHTLAIATPGLVDFNGTITGVTGLDKTGTGTVRFIGANGLTTTGAQSYGGNVQVLSGDAVFDGSSLDFAGDITGANNLSLTSDVINVAGALTGSGAGTFTIAPKSVGTTIGLSGGAGALQVNLNTVSGFTQRVIGRTDGTGTVNVGASTLSANTTVQSGTGAINFGALDGAQALTVNTAGVTSFNGNVTGLTTLSTDAAGSTHFNGSSASATTALSFGDAVVYGGDVSFTAPSITLGGGASGGANLTLATNTLSLGGDLSGSGELTLQPTAAGTAIGLAGGVGTLQITQATLNRVTGFTSQTIGRTDGTGAINANAMTLARNTQVQSASGNVTFNSTVDGARALTVNTTGTTAFNGDVGGTTALASLSTNAGGSTAINASQVRATGALHFGDAVTYTGNTTFSSDTQQFDGGVTGGANLTLVANTLTSGGPISGSGILNILPLTATTIGLAGAGGGGDLLISQALLDQTSGFTQLVIGASTGTVDIQSGALTLGVDTTLQSGTGQIHLQSTVDGAHALTVNTAGLTRFQGNVGSTTALASLTTDAPGTTQIDASAMRTSGAQTYNDPVVTSGVLSLVASTVTLHTVGNLRLGLVNLGLGGDISTDGVLTLEDSLNLGGGVLTLQAGGGPGGGIAFNDSELSGRPGLITGNLLVNEAAAAILQTNGTITTAAGSTLDLQAVNRGSIRIDHTTNEIAGNLKAVSGPEGDTNTGRFSGSGTLPLSFVRVDANQINSAGIEADAVKLTANSLTTNAGTKIRARLPYINAQGIESSVPALTLVLKQPTVINQFGTPATTSWIQVDVGDSFGGYLTVRPKGAGAGSSAVYLGGSEGSVPFYDGTSKSSEIQVYYNGRVPSTPQEVGALSAVTAVIEESRRARFDEAVRTENVSSRLRTGVIAEVGAGRPATEGSESIRMPATCTPTATLGCQ